MLEHLPAWLGHALRNVRAGHDKLAIATPNLAPVGETIRLGSPAFVDGGRLPNRFTDDGDGVSPPLTWSGLPDHTASLALIVEDPDAPTPTPMVHAVVWNIAVASGGLEEGAIARDGEGPGRDVGRNSFLREGWLPPDPPTGHGDHDYVFQLFALGGDAEPPPANPSRSALIAAMSGHVLATGVLVGTYSRGEPAAIGPVGSVAPQPA